jgi:Zn-dependent protease with chaperone function
MNSTVTLAPDDRRWNIPPENKSGNINSIDRYAVKGELKGTSIWVARPNEPREKELIDMLQEVCRKMNIKPVPQLLIYNSNKPNAASSITKSILFSTNLLDTMTHDQVKAVMGHELVHHVNRKSDLIKDIAVDFGIIAGYIVLRDKFVKPTSKLFTSKLAKAGEFIAAFAAFQVVGLWRSRLREYRSDRGGAMVAGPEAMVGALDNLHERVKVIAAEEEKQGKKHYWHKYAPEFLKSHPTHQHRVERIIQEAPHSFIDRHLNEPTVAPLGNTR